MTRSLPPLLGSWSQSGPASLSPRRLPPPDTILGRELISYRFPLAEGIGFRAAVHSPLSSGEGGGFSYPALLPAQSLCYRTPPSGEMAEGCLLEAWGQGLPRPGSWQGTDRVKDGGEASRGWEVEAWVL